PIFWSAVPLAAFAVAAFSLMLLRRFRFSSFTRLPIPHVAWSLGIAFFLIHPPLAYWKKSSAGGTVVSRLSARKSFFEEVFTFVSQELIANKARAAKYKNRDRIFLGFK